MTYIICWPWAYKMALSIEANTIMVEIRSTVEIIIIMYKLVWQLHCP